MLTLEVGDQLRELASAACRILRQHPRETAPGSQNCQIGIALPPGCEESDLAADRRFPRVTWLRR
jgi:hypothetical protein